MKVAALGFANFALFVAVLLSVALVPVSGIVDPVIGIEHQVVENLDRISLANSGLHRPPLPREACYTIVINSYHKRVETLATSLAHYLALPHVWDVVIVFGLADAGDVTPQQTLQVQFLEGLRCWSGRPVKVIAMPREDDSLPGRFIEPVVRGMIETDAVLDLDDDVVAHPLTFAAVFRAWWWNRDLIVSLRSQLRAGVTRDGISAHKCVYGGWKTLFDTTLTPVAEFALTQFAMSSRVIHEAVVDEFSARPGLVEAFRWNGEDIFFNFAAASAKGGGTGRGLVLILECAIAQRASTSSIHFGAGHYEHRTELLRNNFRLFTGVPRLHSYLRARHACDWQSLTSYDITNYSYFANIGTNLVLRTEIEDDELAFVAELLVAHAVKHVAVTMIAHLWGSHGTIDATWYRAVDARLLARVAGVTEVVRAHPVGDPETWGIQPGGALMVALDEATSRAADLVALEAASAAIVKAAFAAAGKSGAELVIIRGSLAVYDFAGDVARGVVGDGIWTGTAYYVPESGGKGESVGDFFVFNRLRPGTRPRRRLVLV